MLEETGLIVRPTVVAEIFQRIMHDDDGRTEYHYVIIDYICELEGGTLQAASDVAAAAWVPVGELDKWKMAPGTPPVIARALEMLK